MFRLSLSKLCILGFHYSCQYVTPTFPGEGYRSTDTQDLPPNHICRFGGFLQLCMRPLPPTILGMYSLSALSLGCNDLNVVMFFAFYCLGFLFLPWSNLRMEQNILAGYCPCVDRVYRVSPFYFDFRPFLIRLKTLRTSFFFISSVCIRVSSRTAKYL